MKSLGLPVSCMCIFISGTFDSRFLCCCLILWSHNSESIVCIFGGPFMCVIYFYMKEDRTMVSWDVHLHILSLSAKLYPHSVYRFLKYTRELIGLVIQFFPYSVSLLLPLRDRFQHVTLWRMDEPNLSVYNEGCQGAESIPPPPWLKLLHPFFYSSTDVMDSEPSTLKPHQTAQRMVEYAVQKHRDRYESCFWKAVGTAAQKSRLWW